MRLRCPEALPLLGALTVVLAVLLAPSILAGQAPPARKLNSSAERTPPVPPPSTFVNLNFLVSAAGSKAPIAGATVTIDHNSGNGMDRTTDASGFCNFGVTSPRTYRFRVTKPDYDPVAGEISVTGSAITVPVRLEGRR
jgi:hypothetical protein